MGLSLFWGIWFCVIITCWFESPQHVIKYLGRYSLKVAITNPRILHLDKENNTVTFSYKDYKDGAKIKIMTLTIEEFIRRLRSHILPKQYRKIRQLGLSANACKAKKLNQARISLGLKYKQLMDKAARKKLAMKRLNIDFEHCPICKAKMKTILLFSASRPPPNEILADLKWNIDNKHYRRLL